MVFSPRTHDRLPSNTIKTVPDAKENRIPTLLRYLAPTLSCPWVYRETKQAVSLQIKSPLYIKENSVFLDKILLFYILMKGRKSTNFVLRGWIKYMSK